MPTRKYRAVFFDLDDTLFDHQAHRREALRSLRDAMAALSGVDLLRLESAHERHLQRTHRAVLSGQLNVSEARRERMCGLLRDFGLAADSNTIDACEEAYRGGYNREWRTVPGARELLVALHDMGLRIAVITNGLQSEQAHKVEVLRLEHHVHDLIVSEAVGFQKPAREFFEHAMARAEVDPSACVVVGDLWDTDIRGALDAGIDSVWLNRYGLPYSPTPTVTMVDSLLPTRKLLDLVCA